MQFQSCFTDWISRSSYHNALRSKAWNLTDEESTLVEVMAWCRLATSHQLSQCLPGFLSPYAITRPPWVDTFATGLCFWWKNINAFRPLQNSCHFVFMNFDSDVTDVPKMTWSNILFNYQRQSIKWNPCSNKWIIIIQSSAVITWSNIVQHHIKITGTQAECEWDAGSTKDSPYLALTGEAECEWDAGSTKDSPYLALTGEAECEWDAGSTKDTPYLALTGKLWGVFCEYLWENWPRYDGTALYSI